MRPDKASSLGTRPGEWVVRWARDPVEGRPLSDRRLQLAGEVVDGGGTSLGQEELTVTRIRANCPSCGEVDLRPDDVVLSVVRACDGLISDASSYRFNCPDCTEVVTKPADERIAQLLTTGGVPVEEASEVADEPVDARPPHPEFPPSGRALSVDDLLDLHEKLESDGWFDELLDIIR
jgi:predicted RNA-binding Zn-ribbon protein involved in translation (DUF1610 family)